jgi:transcriptional regulator with XRE-family HTH domain
MGKKMAAHELLRARLRRGLNTVEAAEAFGVTAAEWHRWEREEPPPDVDGLADWIREGLV